MIYSNFGNQDQRGGSQLIQHQKQIPRRELPDNRIKKRIEIIKEETDGK
jgi:hypothetical protein